MIVIRERDDVRRKYEAVLLLVDRRTANLAFSRALNRTGRPTFTALKRALRKQSDIPRALVDASVTFKPATSRTLQTAITGRGPYLPLRLFGARQFAYGVRAQVWGKHQQYRFGVHRPQIRGRRLQTAHVAPLSHPSTLRAERRQRARQRSVALNVRGIDAERLGPRHA